MIIYKPRIVEENNKVKVIANFTIKNKIQSLWFSFDTKMKEYIVHESSDAFLVALLLLAMKEGEDIELEHPISAKLYYQLKHYVIPALSLANNDWKKINVKYAELDVKGFAPKPNAGTGVSGGVDSFSTIVDHLKEDYFKIDYFTFFNAGSHGDSNFNEAREVFNKRLSLISPFIKESGKELLVIDSNLSEVLNMPHQKTHIVRGVACVLNLQKLFNFYYYASAYRFDYYHLDDIDMAHYEILILNMLSTESTTFYSAVSQYTRVERTSIITTYQPTYKYLNVCTAPSYSLNGENCSICEKCLRTQLTLDILGKIHLYKDVFQIDKYYERKDSFVGRILSEKKQNMLYQEIYELMLSKEYKISFINYIYAFNYKIKNIVISKLRTSKLLKSIYKNIFHTR